MLEKDVVWSTKYRFKVLRGDVQLRIREIIRELLSNLVFEICWSCSDLAGFCGFNTIFKCDACDDFVEVVKAA